VQSEITPEDLFECCQCGQCCCGYGGTYLEEADIRNISSYLAISRDKFLTTFCTPSAGRYLLAQKKNGYCVFFDNLCTIHPVKPRMCMAWPFIENLLRNPSGWDVMAEACPGMRKGFSDEDIKRSVKIKLKELDQVRKHTAADLKNGESR
jgi:Fe-S-cluster containining protein